MIVDSGDCGDVVLLGDTQVYFSVDFFFFVTFVIFLKVAVRVEVLVALIVVVYMLSLYCNSRICFGSISCQISNCLEWLVVSLADVKMVIW